MLETVVIIDTRIILRIDCQMGGVYISLSTFNLLP
jgi:hypothetical protein